MEGLRLREGKAATAMETDKDGKRQTALDGDDAGKKKNVWHLFFCITAGLGLRKRWGLFSYKNHSI